MVWPFKIDWMDKCVRDAMMYAPSPFESEANCATLMAMLGDMGYKLGAPGSKEGSPFVGPLSDTVYSTGSMFWRWGN